MPGINRITCCSDLRLRNTLIRVIEKTSGITPNGKGDTSAAKRAYYPEAPARAIINTPSLAVQERLGSPAAVDAIEVDDPVAAAMVARDIFVTCGYEATVHDDVEPELPKGFMAFVVVPALRGLVLLYWPNKPDMEAVQKFRASGNFGLWTETDGDID